MSRPAACAVGDRLASSPVELVGPAVQADLCRDDSGQAGRSAELRPDDRSDGRSVATRREVCPRVASPPDDWPEDVLCQVDHSRDWAGRSSARSAADPSADGWSADSHQADCSGGRPADDHSSAADSVQHDQSADSAVPHSAGYRRDDWLADWVRADCPVGSADSRTAPYYRYSAGYYSADYCLDDYYPDDSAGQAG